MSLYEVFEIDKNNKTLKIEEKAIKNILDSIHYLNIEAKIIENITKKRNNDFESMKYSEMLNQCVLGDKNSIEKVKGFIRNYILEEKNSLDFKELMNKYSLTEEDLVSVLNEKIFVNNYGLGAIDNLVLDDSINEIWVNGYSKIWIEKNGEKILTDNRFKDNEDVIRVMSQMLQFGEKEISRAKPSVESKMKDGSRITFITNPVAKVPYMNIRKFKAFEITEENILKQKEINDKMLELIKLLMTCRANVLIIGEPSAGKTSFLKFMCGYIDDDLRIGTIETDFELKLQEKYPNKNIFEYEEHEELGITLESLLRTSLRSSPDTIVLGEVRGGSEAEVLADAASRIQTIGTLHVNSVSETVDCLVNIILNNVTRKKEPSFVKELVVNNFDFIIELKRIGRNRKVSKISQIVPKGDFNGGYLLNDIFSYDKETDSFIEENKVALTGKFKNKVLLSGKKENFENYLREV